MQDKILKIIISATQKGVSEAISSTTSAIKSGFDKGKEAVNAFNESIGNGNKAVDKLFTAVQAA